MIDARHLQADRSAEEWIQDSRARMRAREI
jgi:hypothetical protein